jgi:hypothetical protein
MRQFLQTARPLFAAVLSTILALFAFAALSRAGLDTNASLTAALIVAGLVNIHGLLSLNGDLLLPTSRKAVGELSK